MRVLITGLTGFVGAHLAEALYRRGPVEVHGLSRGGSLPDDWGVPGERPTLHVADLAGDASGLARVLRDVRPDWLFHLAGYANTGASFRDPEAAWQGNLVATQNLYEAIERANVRPRVLFVSTGLVYGDPEGPDHVCDERTELRPASPYAASKAAADLFSYQVTRHPGLDVVRARPFNHVGPRQSADYAVANFARQIAAIEAGHQAPLLETGDLSAHRDLSDVRDVVDAYVRLLERGRTGEVYNVGAGQTHAIQNVLERLLTLSSVRIEVRQKTATGRRGDTAVTRADATKLRRETGWSPRHTLDRSLADVLDWWRGCSARLRRGA